MRPSPDSQQVLTVSVSVLIPTFNRAKYLGRCIRSLISQNFPHDKYEIIVIDDDSEDEIDFAILPFKDDVRLIRNSTNLGLPSSLNKGLEAATGEYIVRVDSDDFVSMEFLRSLFFYMNNHPSKDAVACDYFIINDDGQVLSRESARDKPIACGVMYRRSNMLEIGGYDARFRILEDVEFAKRFLEKFSIEYLPLPLYRYRRHDGNITNDTESINKFQKLLKMNRSGN